MSDLSQHDPWLSPGVSQNDLEGFMGFTPGIDEFEDAPSRISLLERVATAAEQYRARLATAHELDAAIDALLESDGRTP